MLWQPQEANKLSLFLLGKKSLKTYSLEKDVKETQKSKEKNNFWFSEQKQHKSIPQAHSEI